MSNTKGIQIDSKAFYRTVFALVVPMALQNLINVGVQSADVVMLGMVDEVVLSAASLAGQVQFVMMLIFFGLASGATVLTAQYWGKGDRRTIEKVIAITLRLSMVVGLAFFLAAELFPTQLMRIFSPDEAVIAYGAQYLRFVAPSYLMVAFTNIYLNIMRSVEKVVIATVVYGVSLVCNIVFNAVLIFGLLGFPAMGIAGAALATTLARVVETVIVSTYAARNRVVRLRLRDFFGMHRLLLGDFMKYSIPTTLNEMFWGLAISANAVIIGHMGAAAVAANSVANVTRQLATVVCFGLANATAILLGKVIGAGDAPRAEVYAQKFIKMTLITGAVGTGVILAVRPIVLQIMSLSPAADDYLRFLLVLMSVYVVAQAFNTTMIVGVFRSGGDTRFGLLLDVCSMWLVSIPLAALAAFVWGWPVKAVYLLILSDEFIKIIPCVLRYKTKRWLKNVTRPMAPDAITAPAGAAGEGAPLPMEGGGTDG